MRWAGQLPKNRLAYESAVFRQLLSFRISSGLRIFARRASALERAAAAFLSRVAASIFRKLASLNTLLSSALRAMSESLEALKTGRPPDTLMHFAELRRLVGFDAYDQDAACYVDDD